MIFCIVCNDSISLPSHSIDLGFGNFCHTECMQQFYDNPNYYGEGYEEDVYLEEDEDDEYAMYGYDYGHD